MNAPQNPVRLDRREAIKWMLTAATAVAFLERRAFGVEAPNAATGTASGYGTDPDLLKEYKPGDFWPLTLTAAQHRTVAVLCDVIIPADDKSPAASSLGVPDFIDEWISAPYPGHDKDRATVIEGLAWLEAEAQRRFGRNFTDLASVQTSAICDDICHVPDAGPGLKKAAQFFKKFRELTAGGFYSTTEGMKDIGYVGNVPLTTFEGPPPEVLRKLGLA
jgi:hypothetical protein